MRAGMIASRLYHRGHVIPAQTDHMEDDGRVSRPGDSQSSRLTKCSHGGSGVAPAIVGG
jgi:hypothetical protein